MVKTFFIFFKKLVIKANQKMKIRVLRTYFLLLAYKIFIKLWAKQKEEKS